MESILSCDNSINHDNAPVLPRRPCSPHQTSAKREEAAAEASTTTTTTSATTRERMSLSTEDNDDARRRRRPQPLYTTTTPLEDEIDDDDALNMEPSRVLRVVSEDRFKSSSPPRHRSYSASTSDHKNHHHHRAPPPTQPTVRKAHSNDRFSSSSSNHNNRKQQPSLVVDRFSNHTTATADRFSSVAGSSLDHPGGAGMDRFSVTSSMLQQQPGGGDPNTQQRRQGNLLRQDSLPKLPQRGGSIQVVIPSPTTKQAPSKQTPWKEDADDNHDSGNISNPRYFKDLQSALANSFTTISDFNDDDDEDEDDDEYSIGLNDAEDHQRPRQRRSEISDITNPTAFLQDSGFISAMSDDSITTTEHTEHDFNISLSCIDKGYDENGADVVDAAGTQDPMIDNADTASSKGERTKTSSSATPSAGPTSTLPPPSAETTSQTVQMLPKQEMDETESVAHSLTQHEDDGNQDTELLATSPVSPTQSEPVSTVRDGNADNSSVPASSGRSSLSIDVSLLPSKLLKLATKFKKGMVVKNHMYHFKTYENCFVGKDAVDFMLENDMAVTREDAVFLGQRFVKELHLFHHVCWDHNFKDSYKFYRFSASSSTTIAAAQNQLAVRASIAAESRLSNAGLVERKMVDAAEVPTDEVSTLRDSSTRGSSSRCSSVSEDLKAIGAMFKQNILVATHTYHFKKYQRTFVGKEAVDYMVRSNLALSREDAVFLGQRLMEELNLFHHCCFDHTFKDAYLFYRYTEEGKEGTGLQEHPANTVDGLLDSPKKLPATSPFGGDHSPHIPKRVGSIILDASPLKTTRASLMSLYDRADFSGELSVTDRQTIVSFDCVQIRMYERILEFHPSTSSGPSIGLGWSYDENEPISIRDDKNDEPSSQSSSRDFLLSRKTREEILKELGYTSREISRAVRLNRKVSDQRRETLNNLTAKTMTDRDEKQQRRGQYGRRRSILSIGGRRR